MTALAALAERSPLWMVGRILIPARYRRAACEARGAHRPVLVEMGRAKVCWGCGTW